MEYVAFLRGINVGGHAIVKMTDLKAIFVKAGCRNVKTYIQSGNVIFDVLPKTAPAVFKRIRAGLLAHLGFEPAIVFRTLAELEQLVDHSPFEKIKAAPDVKLYVVFLAGKPVRLPPLPLVSEKEAVEAIAIRKLDLFVVSRPKKNASYGFPNALSEKALGVATTTRNWNTVTKIVAFARA